MYSTLQKQLLDDALISGQPDFARNHLRKVRASELVCARQRQAGV